MTDQMPMVDLGAYDREDRAVLRYIVAVQQSEGLPLHNPAFGKMSTALVLTREQVDRSIQRLVHAGLVRAEDGRTQFDVGPHWSRIDSVTREGLERSGAWPTAKGLADDLMQALVDRLAQDAETEPGEDGPMRSVARAIGSTSRGVMTEVLAQVISRQLGVS